MKIQEKDQFHGSALTQIVEDKSFKALNRGSEKYGHYLVNADHHVFVKYRKTKSSPWQFLFTSDELMAIHAVAAENKKVFVCLVCGTVTVCALDRSEFTSLIDLSTAGRQWIRIEVPKGGSCHVSGSNGSLSSTVPHNSFPKKVFM